MGRLRFSKDGTKLQELHNHNVPDDYSVKILETGTVKDLEPSDKPDKVKVQSAFEKLRVNSKNSWVLWSHSRLV